MLEENRSEETARLVQELDFTPIVGVYRVDFSGLQVRKDVVISEAIRDEARRDDIVGPGDCQNLKPWNCVHVGKARERESDSDVARIDGIEEI